MSWRGWKSELKLALYTSYACKGKSSRDDTEAADAWAQVKKGYGSEATNHVCHCRW